MGGSTLIALEAHRVKVLIELASLHQEKVRLRAELINQLVSAFADEDLMSARNVLRIVHDEDILSFLEVNVALRRLHHLYQTDRDVVRHVQLHVEATFLVASEVHGAVGAAYSENLFLFELKCCLIIQNHRCRGAVPTRNDKEVSVNK